MPAGVVKWFNRKKGFGFIGMEKPGAEVFMQMADVAKGGDREIAEGDRVEFETVDRSGRLQAKNIRKLNLTRGAE